MMAVEIIESAKAPVFESGLKEVCFSFCQVSGEDLPGRISSMSRLNEGWSLVVWPSESHSLAASHLYKAMKRIETQCIEQGINDVGVEFKEPFLFDAVPKWVVYGNLPRLMEAFRSSTILPVVVGGSAAVDDVLNTFECLKDAGRVEPSGTS